MKNKKNLLIIGFIIVCVTLIFLIIKFFAKNTEETITEITPGEEMTDTQERQTIISLYYINIETNTLVPEARVIDAKDLLENPYKTLVEELMVKSKNEKLKSSIPEGAKVNGAILKEDTVELDLSKEFAENQEKNVEKINLSISAIVNTLTELNEVNHVKILIDGNSDYTFEGTDISLSNSFKRQ